MRLSTTLRLFVLPLVATTLRSAELPKNAATFLENHCIDCHDDATAKGDLDIYSLKFEPSDPKNLAIWTHIHDRALSGEMPPAKKPRPGAEELAAFIKAAGEPLLEAWQKRYTESGRTVARRLNPTEYEYTLRDLLAAPWLELKNMLPPDPESHGFDNVADAQEISYIQMSRFLEAAGVAIDSSMLLRPRIKPKSERVDWGEKGRMYGKGEFAGKGSRETRVIDEWLVILRQPNESQSPFQISGNREHSPGYYKFRVRCKGVHFHNGELLPPKKGHVASINTGAKRILATFDVPDGPEGGVVEFTAWQHENDSLQFYCASLDDRLQPSLNKFPFDHPYSGEGIAVDWFEIEGPFATEECVPGDLIPPSYKRLFGNLPTKKWTEESGLKKPELLHLPDLTANVHGLRSPFQEPEGLMMVVSENPREDAARLLRDFMEAAYRRPVDESEFQRCLSFALQGIEDKACFQDAMRNAYKAVLCSPDFLYFTESPGQLDGHAVASRLSYFFWRSMPDQTLLELAEKGALRDKNVLIGQMDRMLADEKADRFIEDFTDQWLELRNIFETSPDKNLYPEYYGDTHLVNSAVAETRATFAKMLKDDLPVSTVVDSDFAIVNERLAALYGIEGVKGMAMRPVKLPPDSPRGGFLTQASILKVSANGLTTSPVVRGVWVLDRILGNHPPPPPPGAGSIDPDTRGATTVREQLAKHSTAESCASCHVYIDPPGFALESFDVMGSWRERYRSFDKGEPVKKEVAGKNVVFKLGPPVDASGQTVEGSSFADIHGFRKYLLSREDQLAENLVERLITFATGAGVSFADRKEVSRIIKATEASGHGLRSVVKELITSDTFLSK